jgi:hypothetical protein
MSYTPHFVVYFHAWAEVRPATLFVMIAIAVEEHEHSNETSRGGQIESLSLLVDQQRGQHKVVNEEDNQENSKDLPYVKDFGPVYGNLFSGGGPDI